MGFKLLNIVVDRRRERNRLGRIRDYKENLVKTFPMAKHISSGILNPWRNIQLSITEDG
jgi:hypothetical protein